MKRTKKRGFTIVELVIVIAVIAILAAVLIPTFSNIIKKANISADTQLAKNMNTALAMSVSEGNTINDFYDVIKAIKNAGYIMANLNPTAEGNYFAWDKASNQILYLDENLSVIFPKNINYEATELFIPISTLKDKEHILTLNSNVNALLAPKNETSLVNIVKKINNGNLDGINEIVLGDDIVLTTGTGTSNSASSLTVNSETAVVDLILGSQTISVTEEQSVSFGSDRVLQVDNGTLNIYGGNITTDANSYGAIKATGGTLSITDTVMSNCRNNGLSIAVEYRLAHWAQLMKERTDSGISIRKYCENAGIHENTYFYWQRKLREAACSKLPTITETGEKAIMPKGWGKIRESGEITQSQTLTIEAGGCHIVVSGDTDTQLLVKVCKALLQ